MFVLGKEAIMRATVAAARGRGCMRLWYARGVLSVCVLLPAFRSPLVFFFFFVSVGMEITRLQAKTETVVTVLSGLGRQCRVICVCCLV